VHWPVRLTPAPDDAFAARHMPDLGYDVKEFKVFHWRLDGWKKLDKKLTSPDFDCGGHLWSVILRTSSCDRSVLITCTRRRILLFPFGNSTAPANDTVSVYLDYANPKDAPEGWHACAQFALVISNVNDPTNFIVSSASNLRVLSSRMSGAYHRRALPALVLYRCTPPFHRRRERLGLYSFHRAPQDPVCPGPPGACDPRG